MAMSEGFIDFLAAVYAGRKCAQFPGNPHKEHVFAHQGYASVRQDRYPCPTWTQAHDVLTTLNDRFNQPSQPEDRQ